jgi:pyridoxamine 5'-phosphate oxidase
MRDERTMPHRQFLPDVLPEEPLGLVARWLEQAVAADLQPNANAMVLATADAHGAPHARVVLCKELRVQPGYVTFFTNYESGKARELLDNPRAAAVMHWDRLGRQVRFEGRVVQAPASESDRYFASRPWQSRLGAWASRQSEPLGSRADLERALQDAAHRFGTPSPLADAHDPTSAGSSTSAVDAPVSIPRPPHWGGYHLWLETVELWVAGDARLHDRARWQRTLTPVAPPGSAAASTATATTGAAAVAPAARAFNAGPWRCRGREG